VRQHLTAKRLPATPEGIMQTVQDLGCLQLDPISVVARSHTVVLWNRVGIYDPAHLDKLLWQDRVFFEYSAQETSIVLTEEYPIFSGMMRGFANGNSVWDGRIQEFLTENDKLRRAMLDTLKANGPTLSREFEDQSKQPWGSGGWHSGRNVSRMLEFM